MFLYLGGEMVVPLGEVVSLLDVRLAGFETNRRMVEQARSTGRLRGDLAGARALVVTRQGVYASPVSVATLTRRILNLPRSLDAEG